MLQARSRRQPDQVCPLCRDALGDDASQCCAACRTAYHPSCLVELGGCATLGCRLRGALPEPQAQWYCRACHDPIASNAAPRCGCGAILHDGCVPEHATHCRRARALVGPPTPGRVVRALVPGLICSGTLLWTLGWLLPAGAVAPLHLLLAVALGFLPLGLHLIDVSRRREPEADVADHGVAALQLAEPLLLALMIGVAVTAYFSHRLHSLPQGLFMGAVWGFFGGLLGVPLLGALDCLVLAPPKFRSVAGPLLKRLALLGSGFTALASLLYLSGESGELPLSLGVPLVVLLSLLTVTDTLGRGRGAPFR